MLKKQRLPAACLADQNEASWVSLSNKTSPLEWFKAQSAAELARQGRGLWWADYFIQHLEESGSCSLLCCFIFSLRTVAFKYGTAFPVLPRWCDAVLCGVWTAASCHGNRKPPQLRTETFHCVVIAWKWLQQQRHFILLGISHQWLKCTDPTWQDCGS